MRVQNPARALCEIIRVVHLRRATLAAAAYICVYGSMCVRMCDALEITRKHCIQRLDGVFADSGDARARGIVTFSHLFESDGERRTREL